MRAPKLKDKTLAVGNFLDEFEKDDILRRVDLVALFQSFGVKLEKKGAGYAGMCPWRKENKPSLSVSGEKKLYHCFGCGESGDAITLVQKMKGLTFREALEYLKGTSASSATLTNSANSESTATPAGSAHSTSSAHSKGGALGMSEGVALSSSVEDRQNMTEGGALSLSKGETQTTLNDVQKHYARKLTEDARAYLAKRGLTDGAILSRFGVGYGDGTLLAMLGETQKAQLVDLGILHHDEAKDRTWEHFSGCVTFPIFNDAGNMCGMYGRAIDEASKLKHRYLKGEHKSVFNRAASKVYNEIILTECIIDALSLITLGIENAQSLYGANGFTNEHLQTLKDDRVKTVVLALDNDAPGKAASERLAEKLHAEGFAVKIIYPAGGQGSADELVPEQGRGKDWNEYLINGGTKEEVQALIETAPLYKVANTTSATGMAGATEPNSASVDKLTLTKDGIYYAAESENVRYRISGAKEIFVGSLRVAIKAEAVSIATLTEEAESKSFVDTLELFSSKARASFSLNFSKVSGIEPKIIEKDLLTILEEFEAARDKRMFSGASEEEKETLTEAEKEQGLALLKDPALFERIVKDMDVLGYVGEDVNKKLLYLAASSRILDDPISVIILSQSAAGKSFLVDTVKRLIPPKETIAVTSLSDQALNYVDDLMHKFLILGEAVHSDSVEHQIREMLSGKELSRLVTVKDEKTGAMKSEVMRRPVIVSAVMSGTNYGINPENASRCFVISADESREQTRRIHEKQREKYTLERYIKKENEVPRILSAHHAAQKLLRKVTVVNAFAHKLNFPDTLMRTRRDHDRFMDLIACVAFLRQYQKETKTQNGTGAEPGRSIEYIECDLVDYRIAHEIMVTGVLSTTMRELPGGSIEFYEIFRKLAKEKAEETRLAVIDASLTQREIRSMTGLGQTWIKEQLRVLLDYEYLVCIRGGGARSKGFYRLRADVEIERLNLSMIPTPDEMQELLKNE